MSGSAPHAPPGWYPDQRMADTERYWDGELWTEHVRPTDLQPPTPALEPVAAGRLERRRAIALSLLAVGALLTVGLMAFGALTLVRSSDDDQIAVGSGQAATDGSGQSGQVGTVEAGDTTDLDDGSVVISEASPDGLGSRDDPLPYDQETQLRFETFGDADGSVWLTTIGSPRDVTAEVLAENPFNEEPPDGVRFVGFDASMTLLRAESEPLAPGFNFSWELFGGETAAVYDIGTIETESFGCGVVPAEFDNFAEVFVGGTVSGTVCIPKPAADLDHPDTRVAIHFIDDARAVFGP
ncbi:MAG: DUF2510 domain-containing protein [Actinomycetota bacterium]